MTTPADHPYLMPRLVAPPIPRPDPNDPPALMHVSRDLRGTREGDLWYCLLPVASHWFRISAYIRCTFYDPDHTVALGLVVCNQWGGGRGEVLPAEGGGVVFSVGSGANYTPPELGAHAVFAARTGYQDDLKYLHYSGLCSDVVSGLGNVDSIHTQTGLKWQGIILERDRSAEAATLEDAIRYKAYWLKDKGAYYNPAAALQAEARRRGSGAVMTDEFEIARGIEYICQGFADRIVATVKGRYAPEDFFEVAW